jgi:uncharacterized protein (TIGR02453 family)
VPQPKPFLYNNKSSLERQEFMTDIDLKPMFDFLSELEGHNNKPWFEEHRADYERARVCFENFVDGLLLTYGGVEDFGSTRARDCVMRIYRDTRFSKDKSPYRTNMAAMLAPGGKKSTRLGYYLHLQPHDQSLIAGGYYMPTPEQLARFRSKIDRDAAPFKSILAGKEFRKYFGDLEGEKVKTVPQGYSREHPEIDLLRFKQVMAIHRLPDEAVLSPKFGAYTLEVFGAMKPFLDYLNATLL